MLDLDHLAKLRAEKVSESVEAWKKVVWSSEFQKISANMSDGEVETLLNLCESASQFEKITKYLQRKSEEAQTSPYSLLEQEAAREGKDAAAWIKTYGGPS